MHTRLTPIVLPIGVVTGVAGVIGAVWLVRLGEGLIVFGWVAAIGIAYWTLQTIVRGPRAALLGGASNGGGRKPSLGSLRRGFAFLWTYIVVLAWVAFAFTFAGGGHSHADLPPYVLWAFAAATTPWLFLAVSTDDDDRSSDEVAAVTSFVGSLAGAAALFLPDPTWIYPAIALLAASAAGFFASLAFARPDDRQAA